MSAPERIFDADLKNVIIFVPHLVFEICAWAKFGGGHGEHVILFQTGCIICHVPPLFSL